MPRSYNEITGQSLERLAALSDGIFAVAMTLLVLDLHVPASELIHGQRELWHTLAEAAPQLISYLMSFMTLGIFWNGQQAQLTSFTRSDRNLSWIHIAFLFGVSIMPFSTRLLAGFILYRSVLVAYWANILLLGGVLYGSWRYAIRAGLLRAEVTHERQCAVERRILVAQGLYAFGACLCLVNTYVSIGFIVLVQLNFALGLRLPWLAEVSVRAAPTPRYGRRAERRLPPPAAPGQSCLRAQRGNGAAASAAGSGRP
jgi:uncharacterized membrane protein